MISFFGELRKPNAIGRGFDAFVKTFNTPGYDFDVNIIRVVVAGFFIWKLLSRDFSFYGNVPDGVFPFYPINIYNIDNYVLLTGLPILSELATFHWIHWIIPRPDAMGFKIIQFITIGLLVCLLIFGRGPRNIVPILCYSFLIYLWGYLFLGAHEVDAVLLYFGGLLILCFAPYKDRPVWRLGKLIGQAPSVETGRTVSLYFLLFVFYYFASGVNKLTDISLVDWFNYDLIQSMEVYSIRAEFSTTLVPEIFEFLFPYTFMNFIGPPFIYLSHLIVPLVFFSRKTVFKFFCVYAAFHFLAFGVGISFTGYIPVWLFLFPHYAIFEGVRRHLASPSP